MKFNFPPPGGAPHCLNASVKEGMTARGAKSTRGLALERGQRGFIQKARAKKGWASTRFSIPQKHPSAKNWSTKAKSYTREHDFQPFQDSRSPAIDERHACVREFSSSDGPSIIYSAWSRCCGSPLPGQICNLLYYSEIAAKTAPELSSIFPWWSYTHRINYQARKEHDWICCTPDPRRFFYIQPFCRICSVN